jgi:hypothetical protein
MSINPFENIATKLSDDTFVAQTFVADAYVVSSFISQRHSFIWGSRGSGKSTLLKYFEPYCQTNKYKDWITYTKNNDAFIGIYCPIQRGMLDESKFAKLDAYIKQILPKHLFNMLISQRLFQTFINISESIEFNINGENKKRFIDELICILGATNDMRKNVEISETNVLEFAERFIDKEIIRINKYIQLSPIKDIQYNCCITDYHDYIIPLVRLIKEIFNIHIPVYFMFDDAGYAPYSVRQYLNTWIANRDNKDIVVKIASNRLSYNNFIAEDGYEIEKIHDYIDIQLDYTYRSDKATFKKNAIAIAKKRLELSDINQKDPEILFMEDEEHKNLLIQARSNAIGLVNNESGIVDINRFVIRRTVAELHKLLASKKRIRSYSGLNNIISLSSGNYRNFLRIAEAVLKYVVEEQKEDIRKLNQIKAEYQQSAILKFSKDEFERIRDLRIDIKAEITEGTCNLIESMCEVFKFRLRESQYEESAITAFYIKEYDKLNELQKKIIDYALMNRFLISTSMRSKSGLGRDIVYEINKLFIPAFNLEPSSFSGRISFTAEEIGKAMKNKESFISDYKSKCNVGQNDYQQCELDDYLE